MLVPDINDEGVVVACGIAAVVNRSEDDHYEVLAVVLYALDLLLDVPCVELWDIFYFVPEEDVALLLRYSKQHHIHYIETTVSLIIMLSLNIVYNVVH